MVSNVTTLMYDQLLQFDPVKDKGAIVPDLASSYETPEPTTIVFTLSDATFHDGTPFTSADVKATMDRIKNPPEGVISVRQKQFDILDSVETPDDRTATFHLTQPSASFFGTLAHMNPAIYSAKDISSGFDFKTKVNGTGPFMLDQVNAGSLYRVKRNPNYFVKDLPYLDAWEFHIIPEAVATYAAFQTKNLDVYGPATADIASIQKMSDVTLEQAAGTAFWRTVIATFKDPWKDQRVWKAIHMSINKDDFNQAVYEGTNQTGAMMPPGSEWALSEDELLQVPGYKGIGDGKESNMDTRWTEARKLMDAAAFPKSVKADLFGRSDSDSFKTWAAVFADGVRHVGIDTNQNLFERGTYDQRLAAGDFGDLAANSGSLVFPDPTPVFADTYLKGSPRNYQQVDVPEVDDLFTKQEAELDRSKRFELQKQMQKAYLAVYPETAPFTVARLAFWNYVKNIPFIYGSIYQGKKRQYIWLDT